ncbi:hypothetical protein V6N11_075717 [Hibiscus sabdariffa]|uniref:Secreted protein n=1 Tax=Hibiscus sabdariffa TaxID=183260 RepID=A0ABR2A4W6_9ROSI
MGVGMMVWCASSGTPMPLLATMLVTALVVGSTLSRPFTVAGAGDWLPCLVSKSFFLVCKPSLPRGLWIGPCGLAMFLAAPGGCWLSLREPPWSVLGSLGVRDPGARASAFACAYGCFSVVNSWLLGLSRVGLGMLDGPEGASLVRDVGPARPWHIRP